MDAGVSRNILPAARDYLAHFPIVFIEGARQVGKSTLTRQLLGSDPDTIFVNFDDPSVLSAAKENPTLFVNQARKTLVLDEVQRYPEIFLAIKSSVDSNRRPGRFLATGSVGVLRAPSTPESLAGRALTIRLRGFSQGEVRGVQEDFVSFFRTLGSPFGISSSLGRTDYVERITVGGFPELRDKPRRIRRAWLKEYVERIIEKDVGIFPRGTQPQRLKSVLSLIAGNHSGELVYSRLANELDVSMPSMKDSVDALENVFLIDRIPAWSSNVTKREVARPKVIISDSGLAAHLMGSSSDSMADLTSPAMGPLLEGFVAAELLKQREWASEHFDLYHFRDRTGNEVDFVLVLEDGGILGIEVKATGDPRDHHVKGLKVLRDRVGTKWRGGVLLHTGAEGLALGDDIFALPVSTLWGEHQPGL